MTFEAPCAGSCEAAYWSADGRLLAYTDVDEGNATSSVEVIQPGGRPRRAAPSGVAYLRRRISPNRRFVAYCYATDPEERDDAMVVDGNLPPYQP